MKLHTVIVSYNRPQLLQRTIESYLNTVTLPYYLMVVDNNSNQQTKNLIYAYSSFGDVDAVIHLTENRYPGYAANQGWDMRQENTHLLHRSDNDVEYKPGWCKEVVRCFKEFPDLWQLGLRTVEEEGAHPNVGGNCILRREAYDAGIRYSGQPWTAQPFEDTHMSQLVHRAGKLTGRVQRPCIEHIGIANRDDPYYQETFAVRRITFEQYGL